MSSPAEAYDGLSPLEQSVIAAMLVHHAPLLLNELTRALHQSELPGLGVRTLTTGRVLPVLNGLQTRGLTRKLARGWCVEPTRLHTLAEACAQSGMLATAYAEFPVRHYGSSHEMLVRSLFLELYLEEGGGDPYIKGYLARRDDLGRLLVEAYGWGASRATLERAGSERAAAYVEACLTLAVEQLFVLGDELIAYLEASPSHALRAGLAQYFALRGESERARGSIGGLASPEALAALAFTEWTSGDVARARAGMRAAVESTRTRSSGRLKGILHPLWPWITLLLLTDVSDASASALGTDLLLLYHKKLRIEDRTLACLAQIQQQMVSTRTTAHVPLSLPDSAWSQVLLQGVHLQLAGTRPDPHYEVRRKELVAEARAAGFRWLAEVLAAPERAQLTVSEPPWQRALRALEVAAGVAAPTAAPKAERLVWVLTLHAGRCSVAPRLQTAKGASFTSGRAVSLKRLAEVTQEDPLVDEHDRRVLAHLETRFDPSGWGHTQTTLDFAPQAALALVGHPRVFADTECTQAITVERGVVSIQVSPRDDGGWLVEMHPAGATLLELYAERSGHDRVLIYAPTPEQQRVGEALPKKGLALPAEARDVAKRTLGRLASLFPMQSSLELDASELVEVEPDTRIHVQLRRMPSGMRMAFSVAPLGGPTRLIPGEGNAVTTDQRGDERVHCRRDLALERENLAALREALSLDGDETVLAVSSLIESLEIVSTLHSLAEQVVVEWPDGDPLSIAAARDTADLRVRIGDERTWLSAEGELPVDDTLTLSFHALLAGSQPRHGRFVALDDGRFLALSAALQRSIENLEALARVEEDKLVLHPLALLALGQLEGLDASDTLRERIVRAREATTLHVQVPATFEATLRPYQEEGLTFLGRLAHWQAGACLADDMGLGKTLQTLALLVQRAEGGPALVVAPTSVCANWLDEARKFAPTLRVRMLSGDRARVLAELAPYDLLVCSYGVLQQERERLSEITFHTAVLDEAQAIKNANTQRARAAFAIQASQRIALTGTPIENHLGELWSILHFLNPGMLGTERQFEQRFARAIQRDGDRTRAQMLRRLVAPFVLRRKKSEVLDDLPEKTVITLRIEPSDEERALYRALREQALARIQQSEPGQARMQLFAELMRLRRAACHPALVVPEPLPSSKLAALEALVQELRENGHRALLFSQFVDHLTLVRTRLEELGVPYQYLDGSSSPTARSAATRAFQRGEGDLFLISLKAGGFGLNLTAADYVIHLDPWWNPAVEDQASDRAHRIGQTRPVTIYRLVMQGSIEEKILALHTSKRELADDVLAGESRDAFDMEQLLELLADAHAPLRTNRRREQQRDV
jgi:SNF2-related domain/Helicase conserved C-terminal domain